MKTKVLFYLIVVMLLFGFKKAVAQTTYTWNGGSAGNWNTASNWKVGAATASVYPGQVLNNDIAQITNSNVTITYSSNVTISQLNTPSYGTSGLTISFAGITPTLTISNGISIAQPVSAAIGLTFTGTGVATIAGGAAFSYQSGFAIGAGATVTFNAGTVTLTNSNGNVANAGTLNCAGCTINSTGSFSNTGNMSITSSGKINFTGTPSYITNSGNLNVTSASIIFGNNANYLQNLAGGVVTANSGTLNMSGAGAYITNANIIKATGTTFSFGNGNHIINSAGASFTTQSSCTFGLTTSSSYISNLGTWNDHTSTFTLSGQGANIQNTGTAMHISGTKINMVSGGGGNAQILNNTTSFTADSGSAITAGTYTSRITNSGTFKAGTSGSSCVITLSAQSAYVSNTNIFNLGSTSIIYPSAVTTSVNNVSGTFTLQSDANGSAAIGPLNTTSSQLAVCTGSFNVERFFQGSTLYDNTKGRWLARNYRIISSPVNTPTPSSVFTLNYIVGATAGQTTAASSATNAFITDCNGGNTTAGNPSVYLYSEVYTPSNATFTSGNFIGITDISSPPSIITSGSATSYTLPVGTGVFFFFRGAASSWSTRTVSPYLAPENVTLTSVGSINQQAITFKDWYTSGLSTLALTGSGTTGNYHVRGFNMIGNPYPCSIDWNTVNTGGITAVNINPTVYVFDPVTSQYDTYNSTTATGNPVNTTGIIVSGQGFFVQANTSNPLKSPSLIINENAKSATSQQLSGNLLMGKPVQNAVSQLLRLRLAIDTLNYDDIAIGFNPAASAKYENTFDALYLPGMNAMEGLSSLSADSVQLAMNFLPLPNQKPQVINLDVEARRTGQYTLQKTALDALPKIYNLWLMDNYKKDSLDIRNNSKYIFDVDLADTNSYGKNRFQLVIRQDPALGIHLLNFTASKVSGGSQVLWKTENEQNYSNFTVERSSDQGATFVVLAGFASDALGNYSFLDKTPRSGTYQYRLKIEDLNGVVSYSNIVTLVYGNPGNTVASNISIYPNPAGSTINLAVNQSSTSPTANISSSQNPGVTPSLAAYAPAGTSSYTIKITNVTGAIVKSAISSSPTWQGNIAGLLPGTYVIQVINNSNNSLVGKSTFIKL